MQCEVPVRFAHGWVQRLRHPATADSFADMELQAYLDRIGFAGPARPDLDTLRRVHRHHLLAVTYENLSVQFGAPVSVDPAAAYRRIVEERRGGWCYEMNGLLGWGLEQIGFPVMRMAAGVRRADLGDRVVGNHLALAVEVDGEPWLADVGFGDGLREPVRLVPGPVEQSGLRYRLDEVDDGWWRLTNHPHGGAPDFDFRHEPADEALLDRMCGWLGTSEESSFVQNLVCQRFTDTSIEVLRGRVRRSVSARGVEQRILDDAEGLQWEIEHTFGLDIDVRPLWSRVLARHEAVFGGA